MINYYNFESWEILIILPNLFKLFTIAQIEVQWCNIQNSNLSYCDTAPKSRNSGTRHGSTIFARQQLHTLQGLRCKRIDDSRFGYHDNCNGFRHNAISKEQNRTIRGSVFYHGRLTVITRNDRWVITDYKYWDLSLQVGAVSNLRQ